MRRTRGRHSRSRIEEKGAAPIKAQGRWVVRKVSCEAFAIYREASRSYGAAEPSITLLAFLVTSDLLLAFSAYAFVTSITPGPSNMMLLAGSLHPILIPAS